MKLPEPDFRIGQPVRVILNDLDRTPHEGTIRDIIWHHKQKRYCFYLEEGGRKVSKRYFADDLEPVELANDMLVDKLLHSNPGFQALVAKSKASPRKPLAFGDQG